MALTASQISALSVELLTRNLALPMTVSRVPGGEFAGSNGDTVTVRVRQPRSANVQTNPGDAVTFTNISETAVNVTLTHLYDGVNVTDEELSLELVSFGSQVTEPQVRAIAVGAEDELATAMNGLATEATMDTSSPSNGPEAETERVILQAREALSAADVPMGDRTLAVAPDMMTRLLSVPNFVRSDALGDGRSTALRDAMMGRIYGFNVVESNGLTASTGVAYHRSGFVFANRTPVVPRGATDSATRTESGIGMRHIWQYNPGTLTDQSVLSTFAGAAVVEADRVFKFDAAGVA